MATRPSIPPGDLLLLIFHHLRLHGLRTTAVALLQESGVDPFWLCGPSNELALLRQSVFTGDYSTSHALLAPLHAHVPPTQLTAALGTLGKLQVLEQAFDRPTTGPERRDLLQRLLQTARLKADPPYQPPYPPYLRCSDAQECLDVLLDKSSGHWSRFEERIQCFQVLVRVFRDDLSPEEREHKYVAVNPEQLEWLVQDALLAHGSSDPIALQTRSARLPEDIRSNPEDSDALYLSALPALPVERLEKREKSVSSSVQGPLQSRRRRGGHALAASMALGSTSLSLQEDEASLPVKNPEEVDSVDIHRLGVDVGTNTENPELPALPETADAQVEATITVGEVATQTEEVAKSTKDPEEPDGALKPTLQAWEDDQVDFEDDEEDDQAPLHYDRLTVEHLYKAQVVAAAREPHAVRAIAVHSTGTTSQLAIGTNARALRLLDISTAALDLDSVCPSGPQQQQHLPLLPVVREWHKHQRSAVYCVSWGSTPHFDGVQLASGDASGSVKVLRLPYAALQGGLPPGEALDATTTWSGRHEGKLRAVKFTPGSSGLLWTTASGDHYVRSWDVSHSVGHAVGHTTSLAALPGHEDEIHALALPPEGSNWLATTSADRSLRLWDARVGRCARLLAVGLPYPGLSLDFQPQRPELLAAGHQDGSVSLWDLRGGSGLALSMVRPHEDECRAVSWSPDGKWLLSGGFDGSVRFLEVGRKLEVVGAALPHPDKVLQAVWHPTSPGIITSGADKLVKLWKLR